MQLKEFSLISPAVESGSVLKALETAIPKKAIEQAIGETDSYEDRKRALPSHLVVCLIIAMSLWSRATISNCPQKSCRWFERSLRKSRAEKREFLVSHQLLKHDSGLDLK